MNEEIEELLKNLEMSKEEQIRYLEDRGYSMNYNPITFEWSWIKKWMKIHRSVWNAEKNLSGHEATAGTVHYVN